MKKLNWLVIFALVASLGFFTSCGEEEEEKAPEASITSPTVSEDDKITVVEGSELTVKVLFTAGTEELTSYNVRYVNEDILTEEEQKSVKGEKTSVTKDIVIASAKDGLLTIEVTDKAGKKATVSVTIVTTNEPVALIAKGTSLTFGASGASAGSYYSLATSAVLTSSAAKDAAGTVTFVYNWTDAEKATVYSPTASTVLTGDGVTGTATETKFEKANSIDFATVTDADIKDINPTATKITGLAKDDVIVFLTADDKKGVILIGDIVEQTDGTAVISVKIKE
jgi:hypothetical protein